MIENQKASIISILQESGECVSDADSFIFAPLGEGMGYRSQLWTVFIGERKYAVKISDPIQRVGELCRNGEIPDGVSEIFTKCFTNLHNRELQVYQWFKGMIVMADHSSQSAPAVTRGACLSLHTIFSVISGVAAYQTAFLSTVEKIDLIANDLIFTIGSSSFINCIDKISEKDWLTDDWKMALAEWAHPERLRSMQYDRGDGDLLHTLCHMDLWTNNILFARAHNELALLAVVDWQDAAVGNPLLDIASVIGLNMDPSERRAHEPEILQHYIDAIEEKRHTFRKEFPIGTVEQLLPSYRRALRFAALQLVTQLGYRPEEDVIEEATAVCRGKEKLGIYSARLNAILEDIGQIAY